MLKYMRAIVIVGGIGICAAPLHGAVSPARDVLKRVFGMWQVASRKKMPAADPALYKILEPHAHTLKRAADTFAQAPGFDHILETLKRGAGVESTVRGMMYEIECALYLQEQGYKVTAFAHVLKHGKKTREFDVVTAEGLAVECKTVSWKGCDDSKLLRQLKDQARIAAAYHLKHIVYSQNPVPHVWQEKLEKLGVTWYEYSADADPEPLISF